MVGVPGTSNDVEMIEGCRSMKVASLGFIEYASLCVNGLRRLSEWDGLGLLRSLSDGASTLIRLVGRG